MIKANEIRAAAYIRVSSAKQTEKSPGEQRAEIIKLAEREGYKLVEVYQDDAITGDSGTDRRPGLASLLEAAQAGKFKVALAWHTNRLTREDPMDAVVFYNQLRKAGVGLHTCCEGSIDLEDFSKQLLLFVGSKGNNDYLKEHSSKVLRSLIATAKKGTRTGGTLTYGMERGLFDTEGRLVRRLQNGEHIRLPGHVVRNVPTTDPAKLAAIQYAFERFDTASISIQALAHEMEEKGFPRPISGRWYGDTLAYMLRNPVYCGIGRYGALCKGKYYVADGEDVSARTINGHKSTKKLRRQREEWLLVPDAHEAIIPVDRFQRVQAKLPGRKLRPNPKALYPLSGLVYCEHCGKPMFGRRKDHVEYVCSTYLRQGKAGGCGFQRVNAEQIESWLVGALQDYYLGDGREELLAEVKRQLGAEAKEKGGKADLKRLEKQAADLGRQVDRLVKAIRISDAPQLVEELEQARREHQTALQAVQDAARIREPKSLDREAEAIVERLWSIGDRLNSNDPAIVREAFRQLVARIECRWQAEPSRNEKRITCHLLGGTVYLNNPELYTFARTDCPAPGDCVLGGNVPGIE